MLALKGFPKSLLSVAVLSLSQLSSLNSLAGALNAMSLSLLPAKEAGANTCLVGAVGLRGWRFFDVLARVWSLALFAAASRPEGLRIGRIDLQFHHREASAVVTSKTLRTALPRTLTSNISRLRPTLSSMQDWRRCSSRGSVRSMI